MSSEKLKFTKRQKEILNAATKILSCGNIDELTIKNIASKVGVSEPAIYRHFDSKHDLLVSIAAYMAENWQKLFDKLCLPKEETLKQMEILFTGTIEYFSDNTTISDAFQTLRMYSANQTAMTKLTKVIDLVKERIIELIKEGQAVKKIRDDISPEILSEIVFHSLGGLLEQWNLLGQTYELKKKWILLWSGLRKMLENPCEP